MKPDELAVKVLEEYKIKDIPAKSFQKIFDTNNINCIEKHFADQSFSGGLFRQGNISAILINTSVDYQPRINFTKAHELGHFFLKHKGDKFTCTTQDLKTNDKFHKPFEVEANKFASSFLLPKDRVELFLDDDIFDISTISEIANSYLVSLSVATIRLIPMLKGKWCAVWVSNGIIEWIVKSPAFKYRTLNAGESINHNSITYKCLYSNYEPAKGEYIKVSEDSWLNTSVRGIKLYELVKPLPSVNATLSLIKVK